MSKHCFHYDFAGWLRSRKLASFAENVGGDRTPEPSQSPVRRIASITISSPHTPRTKARRSKPHRALITVLKDALLCMSCASFARKICSAVSSCSNAKSQHSATEYLRPEIAVAAAAGSEPRPEERACGRMQACALLRMRPSRRVAARAIETLERDEWRCAAPQHEGRVFKLHPQINLVLRSARHPEARVPHLGRAPRRIARVSKDGHKRDRASGHPSRRRFAPPQDEAFETRRSARN